MTPRDRAIAWAKGILADPAAVVLDSETLGIDPRAGLCDLAVVAIDGTPIFDSLINPGRSIPAGASAVHGITDAMVAGSPSFRDVYPDVAAVLGGRRVVVYNAAFDAAVLDCCCDEAEVPALGALGWECALKAVADFYGETTLNRRRPGFRWFRLGEVAKRLGVAAPSAHRALADCLTTLAVVRAMAAAEPVPKQGELFAAGTLPRRSKDWTK